MKISYINLCGKSFPLVFSLSAASRLCDEFGDLDKMHKKITAAGMKDRVEAIDKMLVILMDAGRVYCEAAGIAVPDALPCRPGDVIDVSDPDTISAIFSAIASDTKREVKTESKNGKPTQGN